MAQRSSSIYSRMAVGLDPSPPRTYHLGYLRALKGPKGPVIWVLEGFRPTVSGTRRNIVWLQPPAYEDPIYGCYEVGAVAKE